MKKTLTIFASTRDDIHYGVVWMELDIITVRPIIKITNIENRKKVYCELMKIDGNFKNFYNKKCSGRVPIEEHGKAIVINNWYRNKFGIEQTQMEVDLEITTPLFPWWGKFRACMHHPQIVVRMSIWLSILGVSLGFLSLCISLKCQ